MTNKLIVSSLNNQARSSQNKNSIPKEVFNNFNSPDKLANELQEHVDRIVRQCPDVDGMKIP